MTTPHLLRINLNPHDIVPLGLGFRVLRRNICYQGEGILTIMPGRKQVGDGRHEVNLAGAQHCDGKGSPEETNLQSPCLAFTYEP